MNNCHYKRSKNQTGKCTNYTKNYSFICKYLAGIFTSHTERTHCSNLSDSFIQNHTICVRYAYHYNHKNYNKNYSCNDVNNIQYSFNLRDFIIQSFYCVLNTLPFVFRLLWVYLLFNTLSNICRIFFHCFKTTCYIDFRINLAVLTDSCFNCHCRFCLLIFITQIK